MAQQAFKHTCSQSPYVASVRIFLLVQSLGTHIRQRLHERVDLAFSLLEFARQFKVGQFRPAYSSAHEDVRCLEVPMQHAVLVQEFQPFQAMFRDIHRDIFASSSS